MQSKGTINSPNENEDEDQSLLYSTSYQQQNDRIIFKTVDDSTIGINKIDAEENETKPLLDEYKVEQTSSRFSLCINIPARYSVAICAFFGFICLYSMRVNLSVAI